ncbi:hypothetical protein GIB67_004900 [Kingdonia uniflora]|uniref:Uncharacterized protein n=1 Tax=Kingdonia uniflora TaxID=39325 RepID=A0A7J7LNL3_9MAGN|nr:hypothetical protein GIB67_004900 [Kingdonia uniflora]
MFSKENIPSTKLVLSTAASLAASAMLIRTIANDFLPSEAQNYIFSTLRSISNRLSSQLTIVIEESDGLSVNKIYEATNTYLGTKVNRSTRRLKVCKLEKEKKFEITMDKNEEIVDVFQGVKLKWRFVCTPSKTLNTGFNRRGQNMFSLRSENRAFELSFHKKHKQTVLDHYLLYLLREFKAIKEESKVLKLHTIDFNSGDYWRSVNLDHPATFDTIAMDSDLKNTLIHDLDKFIERKDMYKRVGKAWKRGYLLYGPPGTGKSSLIAAVGNYLNFDIYDMDLTDIRCNSDLRRILLATSNRSILVLEDIDCTSKLENREIEIDGRSNRENERVPQLLTDMSRGVDVMALRVPPDDVARPCVIDDKIPGGRTY